MKTQQIFSADATTILNLQHQGAISIAQLKHVPINSLEFISVHRAFNQNKIKVEEVSESGNVNLPFRSLNSKGPIKVES